MPQCHIQAGYVNNDFAYDFEATDSHFVRVFTFIIIIIAAATAAIDDDDDGFRSVIFHDCAQFEKLIETVFSLMKCVANQKNPHRMVRAPKHARHLQTYTLTETKLFLFFSIFFSILNDGQYKNIDVIKLS